jgi:hypothetical protein
MCQSVGAQQINEAMGSIASNVRETSAALEELNKATHHLRASIEQLNQEVEPFKGWGTRAGPDVPSRPGGARAGRPPGGRGGAAGALLAVGRGGRGGSGRLLARPDRGAGSLSGPAGPSPGP